MNRPAEVKHWRLLEGQLQQAAKFLREPDTVELPNRDLGMYLEYTDHGEFETALGALETAAIQSGCKPGFWRRLRRAAQTLQLHGKAETYERRFHDVLARHSQND